MDKLSAKITYDGFSFADWGNSTISTILTASTTTIFTGNLINVLNFNKSNVLLFSDQSGTLTVNHNITQGLTAYSTNIAYVGGTTQNYVVPIITPYYQLSYTTGADQSTFIMFSKVSVFDL
jgi:hypothetical protein